MTWAGPSGPVAAENPYQAAVVNLYCGAVTVQVIALNGGSSAGKSGIARCLQSLLPDPWLSLEWTR